MDGGPPTIGSGEPRGLTIAGSPAATPAPIGALCAGWPMTRNAGAAVLFDASEWGAAGTGPVAVAVEAVLAALAERGGIGPTDVAHVAAARVLADAIDNDSRRPDVTAYTLARATRQLTEFLEALSARSAPPPPSPTDDLDAIVARLSAPPVDAP